MLFNQSSENYKSLIIKKIVNDILFQEALNNKFIIKPFK